MSSAEIGVFGGSGFYSFLDDAEEVAVDTPYGPTSDRIVVGSIGDRGWRSCPATAVTTTCRRTPSRTAPTSGQ